VERGVVYYYHTVQSLMGTNIVMMGNALELSFQSGGMGGFIEETFILEGMQDPDDPWEKDPGDLIVKVKSACLPGLGLGLRLGLVACHTRCYVLSCAPRSSRVKHFMVVRHACDYT